MDSHELDRLRRKLEQLKGELLAEGDVQVRVEPAEAVATAADEDEQPHQEMDQSIASNRNRERARVMARIDAALKRMDADPEGYGLCQGCDEPIPIRRLELMPFARLCVECQSRQDRRVAAGSRRHVTDYK